MMLYRLISVATVFGLLSAAPAFSDHPGERLDEEMSAREPYFQRIDRPAPDFDLAAADGSAISLGDFADRIVVLHFVYASCPDVCPLHAEKIADVQELIEATPMRDMVQFVTITTDPANDRDEILATYGTDHGLEASNWMFLTTRSGQDEATTRDLAADFGHKFMPTPDGLQAHGVVTHVIDRGGRWAANFHGMKSKPVNLVLYINGLTHKAPPDRDPTVWDRIRSLF